MSDAKGVSRLMLCVLFTMGVGTGCGTTLSSGVSRPSSAGGENSSSTASVSRSSLTGENSAQSAQRVSQAAERGESIREPQEELLRVRTDALRNRVWVLDLDGVGVYDRIDRSLIRRIPIPPWSVARGVCLPDMALDRTGSAVIASNAQSTLFRIDAVTFEIDVFEIRLRGKEDWDIGFGALAFDADGGLHGLVAFGNSLWRIDLERKSAEMIEAYQPPLQRCALTTYSWGSP
jgi:hypothetical protein